jgi:hypothetical protein
MALYKGQGVGWQGKVHQFHTYRSTEGSSIPIQSEMGIALPISCKYFLETVFRL